ncbi:pseudouridine synthase family protein [Helicobacter felis]|uniref:RNA pseudouridylate synthase n=1 Tax=Helicobacter felis (strain ATCC 49179 / CCUG 28539 / NCTC 12436 / CS1) TaxID=936155 RepID=E7AC94_HELFC|nr:pseudouridine synthase [Helicobacter felis]CBY82981.1 ribosomal pseudouridine synthase [Helicobacter felis ATCC 49179]
MPFVREVFEISTPTPAWRFVAQVLNCNPARAQSHIDRGRLRTLEGVRVGKSAHIVGQVALLHFKASESANLHPIFSSPYFDIYYKPKNLYSHPKNYKSHSLYESVYAHNPEARLIHRLDYETSGLVMVSTQKRYENALRELFSARQIKKTYEAWVQGDVRAYAQGPFSVILRILEPKIKIKHADLAIRCQIAKEGKPSATTIEILNFCPHTQRTHLKITPLSGRTHQIRLHLSALGFPIVGEPLYTDDAHARAYLDAKKADFQGSFKSLQTQLALEAIELKFSLFGLRYGISCSYYNKRTDI